jgi:hypothetical protein
MLGLLSKLLAVRTGDVESRLVKFYHRYVGLEKLLGVAFLLIAVGGALDVYILVQWLGDDQRDLVPTASVAQALIIMGANLVFGGLAAAMVDYETS